MHGHLVSVEVGIVRGADQGMQLNGFSLDENGLKGLDAEPVQGRSPVEHHWIFGHHFFQDIPDGHVFPFHHAFGAFNGRGQTAVFKLGIDKGFEQFQGHFLGQAALMQLELRSDHDHRPSGIIHPLAQQILPEPSLLAFDHIAQGFQGPAVGPGNGLAPPAVVQKSVHRFLEHPFFIADDDIRSPEFQQSFQPVVPVDHPAVEIVEVRGGKTPAVQGHQRSELGRNDRNNLHDHPLRPIPGLEKPFDDFQALRDFFLLGLGTRGQGFILQLGAQLVQVDFFQQFFDRLRPHADSERILPIGFNQLDLLVFIDKLMGLQGRLAGVQDDIAVKIQDFFHIRHGHVQKTGDF